MKPEHWIAIAAIIMTSITTLVNPAVAKFWSWVFDKRPETKPSDQISELESPPQSAKRVWSEGLVKLPWRLAFGIFVPALYMLGNLLSRASMTRGEAALLILTGCLAVVNVALELSRIGLRRINETNDRIDRVQDTMLKFAATMAGTDLETVKREVLEAQAKPPVAQQHEVSEKADP